jgi:hypothetical protein
MAWRHVESGEPVELKVGESQRVYRALACWPEDFKDPGMELYIAAANRGQARERAVSELRELVVGVTHPPVLQVYDLDDELLAGRPGQG